MKGWGFDAYFQVSRIQSLQIHIRRPDGFYRIHWKTPRSIQRYHFTMCVKNQLDVYFEKRKQCIYLLMGSKQ